MFLKINNFIKVRYYLITSIIVANNTNSENLFTPLEHMNKSLGSH